MDDIVTKNDIVNENDETILVKNVEQIEELIINGILSIRKSCSRPSYTTLLTYVNDGDEFNLNAKSLKRVLKDMMENGTIYMKGKKGSESFYVSESSSEEKSFLNLSKVDDVILDNIMSDEVYSNFVNKVKCDVFSYIMGNNLLSTKLEHEFNILSTEHDNKYNSLSTKLEDKINSLNLKDNDKHDSNLNDRMIHENNDYLRKMNSNYNDKYDVLITTLKDEITFLRNELRSKDKIIELIVKESNLPSNKEFKVSTSKTVKRNDGANVNNNRPPLHNKFTRHNSVNDDVNDAIETKVTGERKDISARTNKKQNGKRTINFIADSILKDMKPYDLKHKMKKTDKLYIQSHRGARTSSMKYYAKASQQFTSDIYLLHVGTNDLKLEKSPEVIAKDILDIGVDLKNDGNKVFISSILTRRDDHNEKGKKVNDLLCLQCSEFSLGYIDNSDIITNKHLNQSGIHLNKEGTRLLSEHFLRVINS